MGATGVDKVKAKAGPAGSNVASRDAGAVHANQQATDPGGRDLALVERNEADQGSHGVARDHPGDHEHGNVYTSSCQAVTNDGGERSEKDCPLSAPFVRNPETGDTAEEAANREEAIDGTQEFIRV